MGDCALPDYSEDEYSETFEDSNDEDSAPGMDNFRHNDGRSTRLNESDKRSTKSADDQILSARERLLFHVKDARQYKCSSGEYIANLRKKVLSKKHREIKISSTKNPSTDARNIVMSQSLLPKLTSADIDRENERRVDVLLKSYNIYEDDNNQSGHGRKQSEKKVTDQNKLFDKRRVNFSSGIGTSIGTSPQSHLRNERRNTEERKEVDNRVEHLQIREKALLEAIVELSRQNEDLIKKLKKSMGRELELEKKIAIQTIGIGFSNSSSSYG